MSTNLKIILIVALFIVLLRASRGYFWKTRSGDKIGFKEFMKRWKTGIIELTPLQQTKITLISFMPIFAGVIWGIVVTFMAETYWLTLILSGSLPITSMQFIGNLQKYKAQRAAEEAMKEAMR